MAIALLVVGALLVGISKTSIGGLSVLSVMAFALAMPTKESTGAVLLVYLAGDVVATVRYRRNVSWRMLGELVPWVVPGLVLGAGFLTVVDAVTLRRWIGAIVAVAALVQVAMWWSARRPGASQPESLPPEMQQQVAHFVGSRSISAGTHAGWHRWRTMGAVALAGLAAGFTTMAANAGGAVMSLYLLAKKVDKLTFVGTAAWFFFAVNLAKLPFSIGVGAITASVAWTVAPLVPVVWIGCAIGIQVLKVIPQRAFNALALASAVVASVALLVS